MSSKNCIANLLKLICLLQSNSTDSRSLDTGCAKPYLGSNYGSICYNTRVIQLYKCNGSSMETSYALANNTVLDRKSTRLNSSHL